MSLDKLPVEWLSVQLKDIGNIYTGKTPSSKDVANFNGDIPFIKPGDLDEGGYICKTATHISTQALAALPNLPVNSIMVTCIGNMGKVGITTEVSATNQQINSIVPFKEFISYKYIYYYCLTLKNWLDKESSATTIAIVNKGRFSEAPIPLPPLAEQQEIVRQLDIMLAQVEQIKARLDAIPAILKKFRQSVLADAVSGDLLKNTNLIFNKLALKKLTTKIGSGATPKGGNSAYQEVGIPLVRSLNIHTNYIKYKDLAFINQEQADKLKNVEIFKDDVLLNITGASIGRVNITPKEFIGGRVNQHVAIIRCDQTKLLPQYLHIYLASPNLQKWIEGENYGATRQALTKGMLDSLVVEFPSIEDQIKIISKVNELFNFSNTIEQTAQSAQKRVNLLTQSILAKAFSGELTAEWREQHQELITGINSAESLLAKIQAGREASKPVKKTRKKKEV